MLRKAYEDQINAAFQCTVEPSSKKLRVLDFEEYGKTPFTESLKGGKVKSMFTYESQCDDSHCMEFGKGKDIQLQLLSSDRQLVGEEGCLLCCSSGEWMLFIPPGALSLDREVVVSFYRVVESVGLDYDEFVTGVLEITPHGLQFAKPVEVLFCHHLVMDGTNGKVTVLYQDGMTEWESYTSLCQLSSVNEMISANDMTISLWNNFIHIETSHICRFGAVCNGYIEVWVSLFAPKLLHSQVFSVRLSITSQRPEKHDEEATRMACYGYEHITELMLTLNCRKREGLQLHVQIPSCAKQWKLETSSKLIIPYDEVKYMVVERRPPIMMDFAFSKQGASNVDIVTFTPIFEFNQTHQCILNLRGRDSKINTSSQDRKDNPSDLFEECKDENGSSQSNINGCHHQASSRLGSFDETAVCAPVTHSFEERSTMSDTCSTGRSICVTATSGNVHQSTVAAFGLRKDSQFHGLSRPIVGSDIEFISSCKYLSDRWLQMGWLMFTDIGYTMKRINDEIMKDFVNEAGDVKIFHLIEEWRRLRKDNATAENLLKICCHPMVGGDRSSIEESLYSARGGFTGQLVSSPVNGVSAGNVDTVETPLVHEVDHNSSDIPKQLIETIVEIAPDKWKEIGIHLGVGLQALLDYENKQESTAVKLHSVIVLEWKRSQGDKGTIRHLLEACEAAKVKLGVLEKLRAEHNMTVREA